MIQTRHRKIHPDLAPALVVRETIEAATPEGDVVLSCVYAQIPMVGDALAYAHYVKDKHPGSTVAVEERMV
jgi:hypothetical protein